MAEWWTRKTCFEMAQTSVTNFFASRKRGADVHASKRRKVQRVAVEEDVVTQNVAEAPIAGGKVCPVAKISGKGHLKVPAVEPVSSDTTATCSIDDSNTKKSQPRVRSTRKASTGTRSRTKGSKSKAAGQKDITQFLSSILESNDKTKDVLPEPEPTAACDDHSSSPPCTPTKRVSAEAPQKLSQKRSRPTIRKDLFNVKTPDAYDFTQYAEKSTEQADKERIVMKGRRLSDEVTVACKIGHHDMRMGHTNPAGSTSQEKGILPVQEAKTSSAEGKESTKESVEGNKSAPISKMAQKVPEAEKDISAEKSQSTAKEAPVKITQKSSSKEAPSKSKKGVELAPPKKQESVKEKAPKQKAPLKLSAMKLADLKEMLMEHNKKKTEVKAIKVSRKEKELSKATAPAYERFHNLAQPLPPSLTLPYKYRILLEKFHNTDTVIGMLHKRTELCTFSKLKAAVQNISKRAFEEDALAQIKSVYPSAYVFRQEKGIPVFGKGRTTNYQLTVEVNLTDDLKGYICKSKADEMDSSGKPLLSATRALERRAVFQRNLLDMVKKHHKEFLSSLPKPLSISDDKLTRWHPAFKVDDVPDIPQADLPAAPDVKKFHSAAEVLQQACIKNNRVKAALEIISTQENMKNIEKGSPKSPAQNLPVQNSPARNSPARNSPNAAPSPKPNSQLSGVSMSLLERIRAKEAKKMETILTRTPAQEQRIQMMSRLPDIIRIVRTVFVTSKKPALPFPEAVERIMDSYRSNLGSVEAEKHIRLMVEILPEWISVVKIKAGEYLKVDKNKDLTNVIHKVNKLLQEA